MKYSIVVLFLGLLIFQACKKNDDIPECPNCNFTCVGSSEPDLITNNCIDDWECNFKVTAQSQFDLDEIEGLGSGDKNVFQMINSTEGDLGIADDEFTNVLVFELDENQDSFSVQDSELEEMKTHYRTLCFCSNIAFIAISSGCMEGEKQSDGTWVVQGHLNATNSFGTNEVKFYAQFGN